MMNKTIYDDILNKAIGALGRIKKSLNSYKARANPSTKYIDLQERNLIDLYNHIAFTQDIIDFQIGNLQLTIKHLELEVQRNKNAAKYWEERTKAAWQGELFHSEFNMKLLNTIIDLKTKSDNHTTSNNAQKQ